MWVEEHVFHALGIFFQMLFQCLGNYGSEVGRLQQGFIPYF